MKLDRGHLRFSWVWYMPSAPQSMMWLLAVLTKSMPIQASSSAPQESHSV